MRSLSIAQLNQHLEEMETDVRRFSEELVQQLALRDELDYEKEVKNTFISALIDVQNRQKERRELTRKKKRQQRGGAGTPQGGAEKPPASVSVSPAEGKSFLLFLTRLSLSWSSALQRGGALLGHPEQLPSDLREQLQ